ncbi:MAG: hypothetical protein ACFFAE_21770 [Candidatus Hodarchaeota archaeon]
MANLKFPGRILGLLGGLLMIVFAFVRVLREFADIAIDLGILEFTVVRGLLGTESWMISAAILVICGIIVVYGYKQLAEEQKKNLLLWGIIYIVVGLAAGTVAGLVVLLGGIILVIDYFL